ncbi:MAG TPA: glutamate racemase, partial [Alphaproteobacteria bacterium]|nr:glutamate racemase [Alphaproteobacteria bacterium]
MTAENGERQKKIGIFDSGLGGLYVARAVQQALPDYDYAYLGDTLNVPYGGRSFEAIYKLSEAAIRYLFEQQNCDLAIIACNTASVMALRKLQKEFLVNEYPDKRILGVIVPTLESATELGATQIGLIATEYTVRSKIYNEEIVKITPRATIFAQPTPLLVPLIENQGEKYMDMVLEDYLAPLIEKGLDSLILGCTHYIEIKDRVRTMTRHRVRVLSQDEIIPPKLRDYLNRHPEMEERLSKNGTFSIFATDVNPSFIKNVEKLMGPDMAPQKA